MLHLTTLISATTPRFPDQKYQYAISDKKKATSSRRGQNKHMNLIKQFLFIGVYRACNLPAS